MHSRKRGILGFGLFIGGAMFVAPCVTWASISACASPQTISAAIVGSTANGCSAVNEQFVNFNVSGATGSGDVSFPAVSAGAATGIEFTASGSTVAQLDFQTVNQDASTSCASNTWCVKEGSTAQTATQTFTYAVEGTPSAPKIYGIALTSPSMDMDALLASQTITIQEAFCLGTTSFTCSSTSSNYGYVQIVETSNGGTGTFTAHDTVCLPAAGGCSGATSTTASLGFAGQTDIAVEESVSIHTLGSGSDALALNSFDAQFDEAPEPSTFVLLGSALVGLAALSCRKKA